MAEWEETAPLNRPTTRPEVIEPPKKEDEPQTCMERFKDCLKNITVEPATFLMLFASVLGTVVTTTLSLEKACRVNLNLSAEICDSLNSPNDNSTNHTQYEQIVQSYLATHVIWRSALQTALPCLLLPFVGGWMDMTGRRKILMIIPIIGETLQNFSNIINVALFYQLPVQVLMFFDVFFGSVLGGSGIFFLAIFSYIADITTEENRTHRLGMISICAYVGMPLGLALSGAIFRSLGYYAIYGTGITLHLLNLCYITFLLSDPPRTAEQIKHDGRGICYTLKNFFHPKHVKSTLIVLFKKTSDNRRLRLCIMVITMCIFIGPVYGEGAVLYLSTRLRFNWDTAIFSIYQAYSFILHTIGTIFSMLVFSKYLKWHDSILGIISCTSKISAAFVYCFAATGIIFFLAPAVDILGNTAMLVIRSLFSKMVDHDELGKVNSVVGLFETLMPVIYVSIYTNVYTATMDVLPGAVFLLSIFTTLPAVAVFIWLFVRHRKGLEAKPKTVEAHNNGIEMENKLN